MKVLRHPLFMRPQPEGELEQFIDRELRQLPDRQAPATLLPRVMAAWVERQRRPWWRQSFSHWPGAARIGFLVLTTALTALLAYFVLGLTNGVSPAALGAEARGLLETTPRLFAAAGLAILVCGPATGDQDASDARASAARPAVR